MELQKELQDSKGKPEGNNFLDDLTWEFEREKEDLKRKINFLAQQLENEEKRQEEHLKEKEHEWSERMKVRIREELDKASVLEKNLMEEINSLEDKIKALESANKDLENKNKNTETRLSKEIKELKGQLDDARDTKKHEDEVAKLVNTHEKQIAEFEKQKEEFQITLSINARNSEESQRELERKINILTEENKTLTENNDKLKQRILGFEKKIEEKDEEINNLNARHLEELTETQGRLEEEKNQLRVKLTEELLESNNQVPFF
jgi:chromosome segregation ATPase